MDKIRNVAIVGAGPGGAALGTHLARRGVRVAIFDPGKRPALVVGESLVPALVPLIRELGIEEAVAKVSTYKPGATFYATPNQEISFLFKNAGRDSLRYSYNAPRDAFDSILVANAVQSGVILVHKRAGLIADRHADSVVFDDATRELWRSHMGVEAPDLIVDASGRRRTIAQLLDLPTWRGAREDVALFSHLPDVTTPHEGHIHINRLRHGWSWRIPLPGAVSVGVVISRAHLEEYGPTAEEQYVRLLKDDPILRSYVNEATPLKPVMKYFNYQMSSQRWVGPGWALVGDAGGFIDPIFSSGLLLALEGARELANTILSDWRAGATRYERTMLRKLSAWRSLIQSFYDGRMFSLFRLRKIYGTRAPFKSLTSLVDRQLALALSGADPSSRVRLWFLNLLLYQLSLTPTPFRFRIS